MARRRRNLNACLSSCRPASLGADTPKLVQMTTGSEWRREPAKAAKATKAKLSPDALERNLLERADVILEAVGRRAESSRAASAAGKCTEAFDEYQLALSAITRAVCPLPAGVEPPGMRKAINAVDEAMRSFSDRCEMVPKRR